MAHDRKLALSTVALTKARLPAKLCGAAGTRVRDDLEREVIESGYLAKAPFRWVGLIIREGLVDEPVPHYQGVSKKHGDLALAIEVDTHRLLGATEEQIAAVYRLATLRALVHAGEKYGLEVGRMRDLLREMLEPEGRAPVRG
jgi:hypothetical protein